MKRVVNVVMGLVGVLGIVGSAWATVWSGNVYDSGVQGNINDGTNTGGYSVDTAPANPGDVYWQTTIPYSGAGTHVWSATNINFTTSGWQTDNWGAASTAFIVKLNLAKWIYAFNWQPLGGYAILSDQNSYEWKYSLDGVNWVLSQALVTLPYRVEADGYGYGTIQPSDTWNTTGDTRTLYLGYFGTVNGGGYANLMDQAGSGGLTFWASSTPEPATLVMLSLGGLSLLRRRK